MITMLAKVEQIQTILLSCRYIDFLFILLSIYKDIYILNIENLRIKINK